MNNRLLIGPAAVKNLKIICDAYSESVTTNFANRLSVANVSFHPVFGCKDSIDTAPLQQMRPWTQPTFKDKDIGNYLRSAKALFNLDIVQREIGFFKPKFDILNTEEYLCNRREFFAAIQLIRQVSPWIGDLFDHVTYDVYFTKRDGVVRYQGGGGSTYRLLRLIFMSFRPHERFPEVEMAIAFAHELGHNCFCLLQAGARPISDNSIEKVVYSGVRKVMRPSYASFQALVALAFMLSFSWDYYRQCDGTRDPELKLFLKGKVTELLSDFIQGLAAFDEINLNSLGKIVLFEFIDLKNKIKVDFT